MLKSMLRTSLITLGVLFGVVVLGIAALFTMFYFSIGPAIGGCGPSTSSATSPASVLARA